jgi:hypothetical protein
MNNDASDWLAATVLALFCGTLLYGGIAIQALIR